jgi:transposase-like protein
MDFLPPFCPRTGCPSAFPGGAFAWRRAGFYRRACDRRRVPRFHCRACGHRFSLQSFRLDYRERKPQIDLPVLHGLVSKVTHRQAARLLRVNRKTVELRLRRFAVALRELHRGVLARARRRGGIRGRFSFDELETFEGNRRLCPVTVPVLIERRTLFVIHAEVAPMGARGRLRARERAKRAEREAREGRRPSGSAAAVERCVAELGRSLERGAKLEITTDQKRTYRAAVRRHFAGRLAAHVTESSRRARNRANPLFAINHTFAMMRDGVSRLVRRSWGASKKREMLLRHLWVWIAWRNYVRPITNLAPKVTPAMALLLAGRPLADAELIRWRWPHRMTPLLHSSGPVS